MADGWNSPAAALGALDDRLELLRAECARIGRKIEELRLSCQIVCAVGDDEAAQHPGLQGFNPQLGLVGSVDQAAARARELMDKGLTDFNCMLPPGRRGLACMERLIGEVKPKVS